MTADRTIETIMRTAPVIPVIVINDVADAIPMAQALVAGGLKVLEVTLRTPAALEAIALMKQVEGAIVGAGTVIDPKTLDAALKAGSEFIVSPGLTANLGKAAIASGIPFLPGTANAGDIMLGLDMGLTHFKFFPAMAAGGIPALKALSAPFGQCKFCPTGGVTLETAGNWLALDPVLCVGGSWMIPAGPIDAAAIQRNASAAHSLG